MLGRIYRAVYLTVYLLVLVGALLVAVSGCSKQQVKTETAVQQPEQVKTETVHQQESVQITGKEEKNNEKNLHVDLKIPVINGMGNSSMQSRLNSDFENTALEREKAIKENLKKFMEDSTKYSYPLRDFQLNSDYKVSYNQNGFLSVTTEFYEFTGGANGVTNRISSNINLNTVQEIALKDLFKQETDYKAIINREINRQIAADPKKYFQDDNMKFKTISDNQFFYFENEGIVIYFAMDEIAPHASGIPEFKIPVSLLAKDLKAEFLKLGQSS